MTENSAAELGRGWIPWTGRVLCLLLLAGFTACNTPKIDWNSHIGVYTYNQAVLDLGPPDKEARLTDGTIVAEWLTQRSYVTTVPAFGYAWGYPYYAYPYYRVYPAFPPETLMTSPAYFIRLTFNPEGRLAAWKKFAR